MDTMQAVSLTKMDAGLSYNWVHPLQPASRGG